MKPLRVGFDLDGVILNNPLRNFRVFAKKLKFLKPILFKQKKDPFYFPKTDWERNFWTIVHRSSWRIDTAVEDIKGLTKNKKIEAYIVSGRYSFLTQDFNRWIKKERLLKIFKKAYSNRNDLQPNEFKIKMIKKLKLDIYVEDNFDIIEKLNHHTQAKILWLTNMIDKNIPYQFKFLSLKEVCRFLLKLVLKNRPSLL